MPLDAVTTASGRMRGLGCGEVMPRVEQTMCLGSARLHAALEQLGDDPRELGGVERLRTVAVVAGSEGAVAVFAAGIGGDGDRRHAAAPVVELPHALDQIVAVE